MIISVNKDADKSSFEGLLSRSMFSLQENAKKQTQKYSNLLGNKLEKEIVDVLRYNAYKTEFENSIELISGQRFPDIIAKKYYGVEVKTTNKDHWTSIGSSIAEGTRIDGVERIYMLFGKMHNPIEFKCRPYAECLSDVVVTHSPRYLINMNLREGETFFDKINIPYDILRKQENPIKTVINYYRTNLKTGEDLWWTGTYNETISNPVIRFWDNVTRSEKEDIRIKAFCLFPELLSNRQDKFNQFSIWLCLRNSIMCANIRDIFTAGGQESVILNGKTYIVPKIFKRLYDSLRAIKQQLEQFDCDELSETWKCAVTIKDKSQIWKKLILKNNQSNEMKLIIQSF